MTEIARIVDQLQREHEGDPWHGSPLQAILEGIDADARSRAADPRRPFDLGARAPHDRLEERNRAAAGRRRRLHADRGRLARRRRPDRGALAGGAGSASKPRTTSSIAAVKALPETRLYEPTNDTRSAPLGTGVSYYVLLHGIVQHDVYHAGQIALLKKGR